MSINRVNVSGNLTRDPELRQTAGGMSVLSFGIAVNDRRKNSQTGEWEDYPNFLDCTLFGARADGLSKILTKGSKVAIDGKLRWSQWERDGQKRSKVEIIVDSLDFMSQRNGGQAPAVASAPAAAPVASPATETFGAGTGEAAPVASAPAPEPADAGVEEPYGEDIPF
ncbi:MAG: single-stranded DNA-binding protein [Coriobacteriia bacterium]|nr:single-stranded DNA-binding protein [Coriobacteriia bacterium]